MKRTFYSPIGVREQRLTHLSFSPLSFFLKFLSIHSTAIAQLRLFPLHPNNHSDAVSASLFGSARFNLHYARSTVAIGPPPPLFFEPCTTSRR